VIRHSLTGACAVIFTGATCPPTQCLFYCDKHMPTTAVRGMMNIIVIPFGGAWNRAETWNYKLSSSSTAADLRSGAR